MYTHSMQNYFKIQKLESINPSQQDQINHLIHQLNPDLPVPEISHTQKVIHDPNSHLFIAVDKNQNIIGMIALSHYSQIIGDKKAMIEDFVVDENYRNRGIGKELLKYASDYAKSIDCTLIELTSNPTRCAANNFYQKHGFKLRETNCYRQKI